MKQKILIVDDSAFVHTLVTGGLTGEPVEIHSAYDGTVGLDMAESLRPDLILLDVEMTAPDGFEVCRLLKTDPATAGIPVVFLNGDTSTAQKIRGLDLGAADYITKPFDAAELKARVRVSLRNKYLMDVLAQRASIDGLTGLWNRAYFDQRLASELSRSRRTGRPLACLVLDVDHFKRVNDGHGHAAGDDVLRGVAAVITHACRTEDVACRYGGEEFALLLPETALPGACLAAERLRVAIRRLEVLCQGITIRVTCSIGTADTSGLSTEPAAAAAGLVEAADAALYRAKRLGRDRVVSAATNTPLKIAG